MSAASAAASAAPGDAGGRGPADAGAGFVHLRLRYCHSEVGDALSRCWPSREAEAEWPSFEVRERASRASCRHTKIVSLSSQPDVSVALALEARERASRAS